MKKNEVSLVKKLTYILSELSSGSKLSTKLLAEQFNTTVRIIQEDFNRNIKKLFDDNTIYYDYSIKCYISKTNFLNKTFLSAEELAVIAILKAKSRDKYSSEDFSLKTDALFEMFEDGLNNSIYKSSSLESFQGNKKEIVQIKNAIKSKNEIACIYNSKQRNLYPLKILNLDSFWYLINYDLEYEEIRRYHLMSISEVEILEDGFEFDEEVIEGFDNAINAYYEPHIKPFVVELHLENKVAKYFTRKPINKTQRVLKSYEDESLDIEVYITDYMEIIPLIQSYLPFVKVVFPDELGNIIKKNIQRYPKFKSEVQLLS